VPLLLLCGAVSLVTSWIMLASRSRLAGWLWATTSVIGISMVARVTGLVPEPVVLAAAALVAFANLTARADSRYRYLSEIDPGARPVRAA
jgi:hypothetical protein